MFKHKKQLSDSVVDNSNINSLFISESGKAVNNTTNFKNYVRYKLKSMSIFVSK